MLVGRQNTKAKQGSMRVRSAADAARRQRGNGLAATHQRASLHPLTCSDENRRLFQYESHSKAAFDKIEQVLRQIAQHQNSVDFIHQAQHIAQQGLGFTLPKTMLDNTWVAPLDMRAMYAWCVFETFRRYADEFYNDKPLATPDDAEFQDFIESCGFHTLDFSPCADGRLAHIIRYVLRLPYKGVRRKSYAGAMFDVEDSLQKWIKTEFTRQREGRPNAADEPTRYLKSAVYHYSSSQPDVEGCAAHGSDPIAAAEGALSRLLAFQQGVENSFCCGASIDLLLIGIDTDNDVIRIHLPDAQGYIDADCYVDAKEVYEQTHHTSRANGEAVIGDLIQQLAAAQGVQPSAGMIKLITRLLSNNISQIDYVRTFYKGCYSDIGHQERFIGMGIGFEEVQLRNLTYFAYLRTVEQGAKDVDVGIKIFTGLNINRGLPAPVVIRYDYHGKVPGARERAIARCQCLENALKNRFSELSSKGMLHTFLVVRDCQSDRQSIEVVGSSIQTDVDEGAH